MPLFAKKPVPEIHLPRPHVAQRRVLSSMTRFNVVACGRRWGKTVLGEHRLIPPALEGFPVAWFAPTYKDLEEVWNDFVRITHPITRRRSKTDKRIELITGGVLEFWTLEDEGAGRSRKYKRIVVDEAAKAKGLAERWEASISPTLLDYRGDADFYSTPRGRDFFFQCYSRGVDPLEPEWTSWRMPTSHNPYIHPDEIAALKKRLPERTYRQEIEAEFLEDAGGVFRGVLDCVDKGRTRNTEPEPYARYTQGTDLARIEDFTVVSLLDAKSRQVYFDRFNQISWERQADAVALTSLKYNKAAVTLDTTGIGDPFYELLQKRKCGPVTPFTFTNEAKERLIDNLAVMIEQGKIRLMDVPEQTNELVAYEYEILPSRKVRMNAPPGLHDDCVIALALAAWGTRRVGSVGMCEAIDAGYRG